MASDKIQHVTDSTFQALVQGPTPVLVDFWAEWCMPCKRIAPTVEQLANDYEGRLVVAKVDVETGSNVATQFGVMNIPTLMLFKGGQPVDQIVGAVDKDTIKKMVDRNL